MRLFTELCGSSFSHYFPILRAAAALAAAKSAATKSESESDSERDDDDEATTTTDFEDDWNTKIEDFKSSLKQVDTFLQNMGGPKNSGGDEEEEEEEEEGPFLFGRRFTLAECNLAPFVQRACTILPSSMTKELLLPGEGRRGVNVIVIVDPLELCDSLHLPRLKMWIKAVLERPSVTKTGLSQQEMIDNTRTMLQRFEAMDAATAEQQQQSRQQAKK